MVEKDCELGNKIISADISTFVVGIVGIGKKLKVKVFYFPILMMKNLKKV